MIASWQVGRDTPRQCVEKQRHHSADKCPYSQGYGLLSRHVQVWELDCKDGRAPKNWCLWTMVLRVPWQQEDQTSQSVLKKNQPWILIGRTDTEAEAPIFCPLDVNSQLIGKDPDAGKDWRQKKRATENEMALEEERLDSITDPMNMCSVAQLCLTLCYPMDCSPSGSSGHGIF